MRIFLGSPTIKDLPLSQSRPCFEGVEGAMPPRRRQLKLFACACLRGRARRIFVIRTRWVAVGGSVARGLNPKP